MICPVVYAELAASREWEALKRFLELVGVEVAWEMPEEVWERAGTAMGEYARRRRGGALPRRVLADFLIGAHAEHHGLAVATFDRTVYEAAFQGYGWCPERSSPDGSTDHRSGTEGQGSRLDDSPDVGAGLAVALMAHLPPAGRAREQPVATRTHHRPGPPGKPGVVRDPPREGWVSSKTPSPLSSQLSPSPPSGLWVRLEG